MRGKFYLVSFFWKNIKNKVAVEKLSNNSLLSKISQFVIEETRIKTVLS